MWRNGEKWLGLAISCLLSATPTQARSEGIALTFDDLPGLTQLHSQAYVTYFNMMLLRGLNRHHLPAIGFVNEGKLSELQWPEQVEILQMWLNAGMPLGNHTYSHDSPNSMTVEAYIADIERGEYVTRLLMDQHHWTLQWFRHPYLETGSPLAAKQEIDHWLATHGYRIAPVTMENSDWLFSEPYDDALARHDEARAERIKTSYLVYTNRMIASCRRVARQLFGRNISHVMLLHSSRLNADSIDDLAALLRKNHLHVVSLEKAMKDPAYRTPDGYSGPDGKGWLDRWAITMHREHLDRSKEGPPADIVADYDRVDDDRVSHAP